MDLVSLATPSHTAAFNSFSILKELNAAVCEGVASETSVDLAPIKSS